MRSHQRYKLDAERNTADTNRKSSILWKEKILTTRETTIYTTRPDGTTTTDREPFFLSVVVIVVVMLSIKKMEIVAGQFQSLRVVLSSRALVTRRSRFSFFLFSFSFWRSDIQPQPTSYIIHDGIVLHHAREREREKRKSGKNKPRRLSSVSLEKKGEKI